MSGSLTRDEQRLYLARYNDLPVSPWENGHGETRELTTGAILGHVWRASVATLSASAEFSAFPGKNRIFTNLGPEALTLEVDGAAHLIIPFSPFAFSGNSDTRCHLEGGSYRAFNMIFEGPPDLFSVTATTLTALSPPHSARSKIVVCLERSKAFGGETLASCDSLLLSDNDARGEPLKLFEHPTKVLLVQTGQD